MPTLLVIVALLPLIVTVEPVVSPVKVNPLFASSLIVTVYAVLPANVPCTGLQVTPFGVVILKFAGVVTIVAVVAGVPPVAGAITVSATAISAVSVALN